MKKGFASTTLIIGLIGILIFLAVLYFGFGNGLERFGLLSKKKQEQQQSLAAPSQTGILTTSSITLNETNPRLGDTVHFSYVLPKGVKEEPTGNNGTQARIQVICYQSSVLIYGEAMNAIDAKTKGILLGGASSSWLEVGGPANCVATLYQWFYKGGQQTFNQFVTISFTAAGK